MNEGHNIPPSSINILEYRQVESQQVLILLSGGSNPSTPTKGLFPTLKLHFNRLNYWYGAQPHTGGPTIY